jgi:hypothetical protein
MEAGSGGGSGVCDAGGKGHLCLEVKVESYRVAERALESDGDDDLR